jgi:calnexin
MIPEETAKKPDDWDESIDGEWEPPLKNNPRCEEAPGCGFWSPPVIDNPNFKGNYNYL